MAGAKLAFVAGTALIAAGVVAAQAMTVLHPDGPYTQAATGMVFPTSVGDFRRVDIIHYKDDGTDESAGYNRIAPLAEISATVYVFPSPSLVSVGSSQETVADARKNLCEAQFRAIQQEVVTAHPDAILVSREAVTLEQQGLAGDGNKAVYTLTNGSFFGRANVKSRSEAYVFCYAGGRWTVEYRIDYPAEYDATAPIAEFMRNLTWTITPEN